MNPRQCSELDHACASALSVAGGYALLLGLARLTVATVLQAEVQSEPLQITAVDMSEASLAQLAEAWRLLPPEDKQLAPSLEVFKGLCRDVLSMDIRALRKRLPGARQPQARAALVPLNAQAIEPDLFHLRLLGIDIAYRMTGNGHVVLEGADFVVEQSFCQRSDQ
jgi:hypothetical protein